MMRRIGIAGVRRFHLLNDDSGMSTAEYAVGTIAAVAFATILYGIITGSPVVSALGSLVTKALSVKF